MQLGPTFPEYFHILKIFANIMVACDQMFRLKAFSKMHATQQCEKDVTKKGNADEGTNCIMEEKWAKIMSKETMR